MTHTPASLSHSTLDFSQRRLPGNTDRRAWTVAMVEFSARSRGTSPETRLLGIFDVLDSIINRADREARTFVETMAGMGNERPLDAAGTEILESFRDLIETLAVEADLVGREELSLSWRVLMKGAILRAMDGDLTSASRARGMAVDLIARHRPAVARVTPQPQEFVETGAFDLDEYELYQAAQEPDVAHRPAAALVSTPESRRTEEINDLAWTL